MKAIKIVCVALALITLLITIVFFGWWATKDYWVFGGERFDQVRWITATQTPDNRCHRGDMAHDLRSRLLLTGMPRSLNIRHRRQKPAREPYSYIDSTFMCRWPGQGCAPSTSERNASEVGSPCRILRSPPSS